MFWFEKASEIRQTGEERGGGCVGLGERSFDETTDVPPFINLDLGKTGKGRQREERGVEMQIRGRY